MWALAQGARVDPRAADGEPEYSTPDRRTTMGFSATVVADSINPHDQRLTTLEVTLPRIVLAEFNTHRMLSRNSASSRAIPVLKQIRKVLEDPFVPETFGSHQAGMQSGPPLEGEDHRRAQMAWLDARDRAASSALELLYGFPVDPVMILHAEADLSEVEPVVHKELVNRILEPFQWTTILVTATEWGNFFGLRDHEAAQPQIATAARLMRTAMDASTPEPMLWGEWHLPLIGNMEMNSRLADISASRCAGVSYETHQRRDQEKDLARFEKLLAGGHMSPMEHPACALKGSHANFRGWKQLRTMIPGEDDFSRRG